jgi:sec-independent protein translocase protein TatA
MGISISELLILLVIAIVLFGTKRLRNVGSDLGGAIKGFRNAIKDGDEEKPSSAPDKAIEGEVVSRTHDKD